MFRIEHENRNRRKKRRTKFIQYVHTHIHKKRLINNFDWCLVYSFIKIKAKFIHYRKTVMGKTIFLSWVFWFKFAHFLFEYTHPTGKLEHNFSQNITHVFFHTHTTIFSNSIAL